MDVGKDPDKNRIIVPLDTSAVAFIGCILCTYECADPESYVSADKDFFFVFFN